MNRTQSTRRRNQGLHRRSGTSIGLGTLSVESPIRPASPSSCKARRLLILAYTLVSFLSPVKLAFAQSLDLYFHAQGGSSQSILGAAAVGIGDVNHDGYADIAIAAAGDGATYVYYGNDHRDSIPDLRLPYTNYDLQGLVDIDGDGHYDVVGPTGSVVYVFYGGESTLDTVPRDTVRSPFGFPVGARSFGQAVAVADFDQDGTQDLVVIDDSPNVTTDFSQVLFYSGAIGFLMPVWVLHGTDTHHNYENCLAIDIDGDSIKELVVASSESVGDNYPPQLFIFDSPGFDSIPDLQFVAPPTDYPPARVGFGEVLADIGDFNGDGFNDLAAPAGASAFLFWGGPSIWDSLPDFILGTAPKDIAFAGDVDLGGRTDIVVGHSSYNDNDGRVEVFLGEPPLDSIADYWMGKTDLPPHSLQLIGRVVAPAGDFDGDGAPDVIVVSDNLGSAMYMDVFVLGKHQTSSGILDDPKQPSANPQQEWGLSAYPNPSNTSVLITVTGSPVVISVIDIYNILGKKVRSLSCSAIGGDTSPFNWDGCADNGSRSASGLYFAVARSGATARVAKIVLLK